MYPKHQSIRAKFGRFTYPTSGYPMKVCFVRKGQTRTTGQTMRPSAMYNCVHHKHSTHCHAIPSASCSPARRRRSRRTDVPYKSGWEPHAQQGSQIRRCDRSDENRKGLTGPTRSKGVPWPRTNGVFSATVAPTRAQPAEVRKDRAPLLPIRAPAMSEARNGLSAGKAKSAGREVSSPQPAPTPAAQRLA